MDIPETTTFDLSNLRERALGILYKARRLWNDHGWVVIATTSVCAVLFLIGAVAQGPMFVSRARLMASGQITLPEKAVFQEERLGYFGTQMNILQSPRVQSRALERVQALHPEIKSVPVQVKVSLSTEAAILNLEAIGSQPEYTQAYLIATIQAYQDFKRQMRAQAAEATSLAIHDELLKLQREIDDAETAKVEFQKQHNITFMREQGTSVGNNLVKLKNQQADLTTQYNLLENATIDTLPPGSENLAGLEAAQEYMRTKNDLQNVEMSMAGYKKNLRPGNPKLVTALDRIERLSQKLESLREQSRQSIDRARISLKAQIDNLNGVISTWETKALDFSKQLAEFEQLESRLTRSQTLYDKLVGSVQTLDVSQRLANEMLSTLEDPSPAMRIPSYFLKRGAMGAIVGALLGCSVLFVIGLFDTRLSSVEDLSAQVPFPVFGVIPAEKVEDGKRLKVLSKEDDRPVFSEAYRNLRTSITQARPNGKPAQVIMLTSSIPSEGKTTVSANTAVALGLNNAKVLVIDADLRKGRLHEDLNLPCDRGLSDLLVGKALEPIEYSPTLHFVPRGATMDHPSEILSTPHLAEKLAVWRKQYDYIIIDTPPVLAAEDAALIMAHVDMLVFVVRAHYTQSPQIQAALRLLKQRKMDPNGIIFNLLDLAHPNYYHYKYADYYHRTSKAQSAQS